MFTYRLHSPDGDDLGEATYAQMIHPDEEIIAGSNEHFRGADAVPFEEDESAVRGAATGRGCLGALRYAGLSGLRAYRSSSREEVVRRVSDSANRRCRVGGVTVRDARRPFDNVQR